MSLQVETPSITADYWRAYFEWRATYGLSDECMKELLAAVCAELDCGTKTPEQIEALKALAMLIEVELEDDRKTRHVA